MITVNQHTITELAHEETPNEIFLKANKQTQLHVIKKPNATIIKFPYGNKFDIIDGNIIIHKA